jgi:hypothetical protein
MKKIDKFKIWDKVIFEGDYQTIYWIIDRIYHTTKDKYWYETDKRSYHLSNMSTRFMWRWMRRPTKAEEARYWKD